MAQTYTLDEAAERLGITPEEMKRRLKEDWKTLRAFRDGGTLRFKANDIEELARSLGAASDPGLPLAAMEEQDPPGSDDFKISPTAKQSQPADEPLMFGSTDDDIFSLSGEDSGAARKPDSDVRLGPRSGKVKKPDSDVKVDSGKGKKPDSDAKADSGKPKSGSGKRTPGDSDVRLEGAKSGKHSKDDAAVVPTEEISLEFSGPGSAVIKGGSSAKLTAPKSSSKLSASSDSGKGLSSPGTPTDDSSEFELSLDSDSDDFELQLNTDSSDEVDLGELPKDKSGKQRPGGSGINLRDPGDSGISLEKGPKSSSSTKKSKPPSLEDDSDDFELSLDPSPGGSSKTKSGSKSGSKSGPKSGKIDPVTSDSDSEFELTLDDSSGDSGLEQAALESAEGDKNDIFETDFEIPPMQDESGSEAVAIDSDTDLEKSDFELALNDSDVPSEEETGSQVVLLEDEGGGGDVDLADVSVEDEEESASAALKGVRGRRRHDDDEDEEAVTSPAAVAAPAPWGPFPAIVLAITFPIVFLGFLTGYELLNTMRGYQQPSKPSTPIVRWVAKTFDMDVKDQ